MNKDVVQQLFDRVLTLEADEKIVLKFASESDMKSKKTMLFREKREYEKAMKGKVNFKVFFIRQVTDKQLGKWILELSTNGTSLDWFSDAVIVKRGGETKPLDIEVVDAEKERVARIKSTM